MPVFSAAFPGPALARIGPNPHPSGRDFVVGDIHGQYQSLMDELLIVEFDPNRDRLFSTGDLVDRGPQSLDCLRLLKRPWFHCVLGNHETMLLTAHAGRPSAYHNPLASRENGGRWVYELNEADTRELEHLLWHLSARPLVMTVEHESGAFNVAHAQLIHPAYESVLADDERDQTQLSYRTEVLMTWGRGLFHEGRRARVAAEVPLGDGETLRVTGAAMERDLRLSYVGHNVVGSQCLLHRSHLHIDRGAQDLPRDGRLLVLEHAEVMRRLRDAGVLEPA